MYDRGLVHSFDPRLNPTAYYIHLVILLACKVSSDAAAYQSYERSQH